MPKQKRTRKRKEKFYEKQSIAKLDYDCFHIILLFYLPLKITLLKYKYMNIKFVNKDFYQIYHKIFKKRGIRYFLIQSNLYLTPSITYKFKLQQDRSNRLFITFFDNKVKKRRLVRETCNQKEDFHINDRRDDYKYYLINSSNYDENDYKSICTRCKNLDFCKKYRHWACSIENCSAIGTILDLYSSHIHNYCKTCYDLYYNK